ncbi:MAG: HAD family phosphatase [Burkholderiales bacterium]|nr:HAD family phosphatase [Anaerolineae bacterium]
MKTTDYRPRHQWDEKLSLPHGSVERIVHGSATWHKAQTGSVSVADYWADVGAQLGISEGDTQQLADEFYSGDTLDMALVDYIQTLRAAGHIVALLSNDSPALMEKLRALNIDSLFDPLLISANIGVMKPDAAAFQAILTALNRPAPETVFIDDNADNIAGAAALGIHTVHYKGDIHLPSVMESLLSYES